ncbi:MAG: AraC family transcriptional regulator [Bacteroidales bacterium]|nr:AraC family transcriptional regulator [Bacteroidales bacterium]
MQFTFSEKNTINNFCDDLFDNKTQYYYEAKRSFGTGIAYFFEFTPGLKIIYLDVTLNNLILFKWVYKPMSEPSLFFLFNPTTSKSINTSIGETAEKGYTIFDQNNNRRKIWLPNQRYCVLMLEVKHCHLETLNSLLGTNNTLFANYNPMNKLYFQSKINANIKIILNQTINAISDKTAQSNILLQIKCAELIHQTLINANQRKQDSITNRFISDSQHISFPRFIQKLERNIDSIPTITEASKILGMSRSKFQRLFKSHTNTTYHAFVIELKMEYSIELLTSNHTVSETAHLCGYSSIGNFSAAFKRHYNLSPSDISRL